MFKKKQLSENMLTISVDYRWMFNEKQNKGGDYTYRESEVLTI